MSTPAHRTALPPGEGRAYSGRRIVAFLLVAATLTAYGVRKVTVDARADPRQQQARAHIKRLDALLGGFHRTMGRYPTEEEAFSPFVHARVLEAPPRDPWGNPFVYRVRDGHGFVLSYGADGRPGGEGLDADLTSGGVAGAAR